MDRLLVGGACDVNSTLTGAYPSNATIDATGVEPEPDERWRCESQISALIGDVAASCMLTPGTIRYETAGPSADGTVASCGDDLLIGGGCRAPTSRVVGSSYPELLSDGSSHWRCESSGTGNNFAVAVCLTLPPGP
ncbi:MAG: hypothetical protein ACJAYU_003589 [Bradymonadia bacterium]